MTNYVYQPVAVKKSTTSSATWSQESGVTADNRLIVVHTATDDGAGNFLGTLGTVDYGSRQVQIKVVAQDRVTTAYKSDHERASDFESAIADGGGSGGGNSMRGGEYTTTSVGEEVLAGSSLRARYRVAPGAPQARTMTFTPPAVTIDLAPLTTDRIVPGSVMFSWMGTTYEDFEGTIYRGRSGSSPGIASGTLDYTTGIASMSDYVVSASGDPTEFTLLSLWTSKATWRTSSVFFQTGAAPIQPGPGGWTMLITDAHGGAISANVDADGFIGGAHLRGRLDFQFGDGELQFGDYVDDATLSAEQKAQWWYDAAEVGTVQAGKIFRPWPVDPASLRMDYVWFLYMPLDAQVIGMDATMLPPDGLVPIFPAGRYVCINHEDALAPAAYSAGAVITLPRQRLAMVLLLDSLGQPITTGYDADLDAGTVSINDVTGWAQPVTVRHWLSRMARVREARLDGTLRLSKPVAHEFPVGSVVSAALMCGDQGARVVRVFDQYTWDDQQWLDVVSGAPAALTYNEADHPIEVSNLGAITERFAIKFEADGQAFRCVAQHLGFVAAGTKNADFSPINPRSGAPYFTLRAAGWGAANWAPGNTVFVHTQGALAPFAMVRAVQPSEAPALDFQFEFQARFDVDRPAP